MVRHHLQCQHADIFLEPAFWLRSVLSKRGSPSRNNYVGNNQVCLPLPRSSVNRSYYLYRLSTNSYVVTQLGLCPGAVLKVKPIHAEANILDGFSPTGEGSAPE